MTSRKRWTTALLVKAAAAIVLVTATPALAAATWTVTAGSAPAGTTVAFTKTTQGASPQVTFMDVTSNQTLACTSATVPGSIKTGSGRSGTAIATLSGSGTTWNQCTGPLGIAFRITGANTWNLNAVSYAAGVTSGTVTNISATVSDPGQCSFTVTGSVAGTYTNSTQILAVPGTTAGLAISGVSGCFGVVSNGDHAALKASFKAVARTSGYNPITITSP